MIRQRGFELPPPQRDRFNAVTSEFDDAWLVHDEAPPSIENRLPGDEPLRSLILVALIKTDLECRLKKGENATVETYLDRFPELNADPEALIELILWEQELSPDEVANVSRYAARFPHLASALEWRPSPQAVADAWTGPPGFSQLERIGRGSMGVVYSAWEEALKRPVALKVLFPGLLADVTSQVRMRSEAEIVASLRHPNVVEIHRVGEHLGQLYCVFEFCAGGTLDERLRSGPLEADQAARIVMEIARGVHVAHEAGVIHRDLKPANVLYAADGTPKVADFGLAKRLDDAKLTRSGELIGTISYAAPEQLDEANREVTRTADVYAIGSILYHCLTGRPPFVAATHIQTYLQVLRNDPVRPGRLLRLPRALETICLKCLAKDPRQRYASALELADDLARYLARQPIRARPSGSMARLKLWCRRNPALAVASALSIAALLTIAGLSIVFGVQQKQSAADLQVALDGSRRQSAISIWDRGRQLCEAGEVGHGLLTFALALEAVPEGAEQANLREALRIELAAWHRHCHTLQQVWKHPDKVPALAVSPDGKTAVTGCTDGKIRLWDVASGVCRLTLDGHRGSVSAVAFGEQNSIFISGGSDGAVFVWDAGTGKSMRALDRHRLGVTAVALSPAGDMALSSGEDADVRLWNLTTGTFRSVASQEHVVWTVGFSRDGSRFFTGGGGDDSGSFRLYETQSQKLVFTREHDLAVRSAAMSRLGDETILIGDDNWEALFLDAQNQQQIAVSDSARGRVQSVAFAPDGNVALTGAAESNTALVWDVAALRSHRAMLEKEGVVLRERKLPAQLHPALRHPQSVTAVSFIPPDGKKILTACDDGYVRVWQRAPGPAIRILEHNPKNSGHKNREYVISSTAIDASGRLGATAGRDGIVRLWNVESAERDGGTLNCSNPVMTVAFTPDGKSIVSGAKDGRIQIWDRGTRREVGDPMNHADGLSGMSLSANGELIFSGGSGLAQRWNLSTRAIISSAFRHGTANISLATAISPDSRRFLTTGEDGQAKLWASDGELICTLDHENQVRGGAFSQNGKWVITASDDGTARVWDSVSGLPLMTLTHRSEVFSATFAANHRAMTCSREGAQIWDIPLQRRVGTVCKYQDEALHGSLSADGKTALLADGSGYGILWSVPQPVQDNPRFITVWVQMESGMKLDKQGGFQTLSGEAWQAMRDESSDIR